MELIKENKEKQRAVFRLNKNTIRKYWYSKSIDWVTNHIKVLKEVVPGYVINYGITQKGVFADFKNIKGIVASTLPHSDKFMTDIYDYCLKNIEETYPYVHGDWVLSNIIVHDDTFSMCDWDNVSIQPKEEALKKLKKDLQSAFGNRLFEVLI